jgi:tetratricopeptide (TPR) repeat protein
MIEVDCACGARLQLGDEWGGKRGKCPACQAVLDIPLAQPAPSESAWQSPPEAPAPFAPAPFAQTPIAPAPFAPAAVTAASSSPALAAPPARPAFAAPAPAAEPKQAASFLSQPLLMAIVGIAAVSLVLLVGIVVAFSSRGSGGDVANAEPQERLATTAPPPPPAQSSTSPAANVPPTPRTTPSTPPPIPPVPPAPASEVATTTSTTTPASPPDPAPASSSSDDSQGSELTAKTTRPAAKRPPRGLSGVSNRYNDGECCLIQDTFGFRISPAATIIEVNGEVLPVGNVADFQKAPAPLLLLPAGEHLVRLRPGDGAIAVKQDKHFAQVHAEMRQFFQRGGAFQEGELFSRGAQAMDVHGAPFLLNLMGAAYASKDAWDAAERKFRRALRVNPSYSPAHLNLAFCLHRAGKTDEAKRECLLADAFNIGNVYGLTPAIVKLKRELQLAVDHRETVELSVASYVSLEPRTVEDERLEALLLGIEKYATREEEQGKIRNNLAIHFADSRRPELALEHFRGALQSLREAGPDRFKLARQVFSNMHSLCEQSRFPEAAEYAMMRDTVVLGEGP